MKRYKENYKLKNIQRYVLIAVCMFAIIGCNNDKVGEYYPQPNSWKSHPNLEQVFNLSNLNKTVEFAEKNEVKHSNDLKAEIEKAFGSEPFLR